MHTQEEIENSKLELAESLSRLYKNKDFKKIVLEGYLNTGSIFLVKNFVKERTQEGQMNYVEQMKARSHFWKYVDGLEEDASSILSARAYEATVV